MRFPAVLILFSMAAPVFAAAAETPWYYPQDSDTSRRGRQQSSTLRRAIDALGSESVAVIPVPVVGIAGGRVSRNFGDPRDGGARRHEGQDIMASRNSEIISPTAAVVLRVGTIGGGGLTVYTANPGGETFVYMHLERVAAGVAAGTVLRAGQVIAYVGNSGNAAGTAPHLHFEIHNENGVPIDPYPRLAGVRQQTPTARPAAPASPTGVRDLQQGAAGEDVRALQRVLNAAGFRIAAAGPGSPGQETATFGALTREALARYQAANGISPAAGYFGPATRARMKAAGLAGLWW